MKVRRLKEKFGVISVEKYVKAVKDGERSLPSHNSSKTNSKNSSVAIKRFRNQKKLINNAKKVGGI